MGDPGEKATQPSEGRGLLLEEVARAAAELAIEPKLEALLDRFLSRVREWSSASAILAAVRDPSAESGWRLLPALASGSGPLGAERSLPQLVESAPGCLERPTLVSPKGDVPGVRPRDNFVVPWTHEGESGILVLRGVPRPSPPNLGEAVAVLAAPVWPRLLGGPSSRIEALLSELRRVAERLEEDAGRHLESLRASHVSPTSDAGGGPGDARVAELEQRLESARQGAERAETEQATLRARLLGLETALKESESERDRATETVEKLEARAGLLHSEHATALKHLEDRLRAAEAEARMAEEVRAACQRELEEARTEAEHSSLEWDELKGRVAALQEALQEAEGERDRLADEAERLSGRVESMQSDHASAIEQVNERRRTAETALRKALEDLTEAQRETRLAREATGRGLPSESTSDERVSALEVELGRVRAELEQLRGQASRTEERAAEAESALGVSQGDLARKHEELSRAQEELIATQRELEEARSAVAGAQPASSQAEGQAVGSLKTALTVLRRAPFVPPGLRLTLEENEALTTGRREGPAPWMRVVILDRDVASIEPLADELEEAGLDVKIATYPEELALLMKTPEAKGLDAAVCDILAFRPNQTVAGLFRGWEKDRPGLSFFLTFSGDDPAETERANRVPLSLTAGRLRRPIPVVELLEKLQVLAQRKGASGPETQSR